MGKKHIYKLKKIIGAISICCCMGHSYAQNASLLADGVDDFVRRSQLLGKSSLANGLTNRSFEGNYHMLDSLISWPKAIKRVKTTSQWKIDPLPVSITQQFNSRHPYGWNDGAMIPAKGYQVMVSGGIAASYGHLSIQLKPELVYAQNSAFEGFPHEHYDAYWERYYRLLNTSDIPERFGNKAYTRFFPGQSSIRYNTSAISVGVSTENLWWGPGTRNALVMSNQAPGFVHATINTIKPIQTRIGSFEGQVIAGSLSSSGILPPETNRYDGNRLLYIPKKEASRYITGIELTWQPKWIKGLFVGFTRVSYLYGTDIGGIADVLPLSGIIRSSAEKDNRKANLGSLFARYVMPEERAELYMEYGRSDKAPSLLNLATDNGYPRAYVAGFRKLFPARHNAFIELASEFTQMQLPRADLIASSSSWYTHPYVRHGYTHNGQVLGAGIGPGSNSEMIDLSWVRGFTKLGLLFERVARNNDFYYNAFILTNDYTRHWIDLSTSLHIDWQYQKLLLSSQFSLIRSLNYEYYVFPGLPYFENGYDVLNFHANISLSYRL